MSRRPLVSALADAIERVAEADPGVFSAVHVDAVAKPLVDGGALRLRLAAYDLAAALTRDIEVAKLGRGRVTNRRLDQRLRRAKPTSGGLLVDLRPSDETPSA